MSKYGIIVCEVLRIGQGKNLGPQQDDDFPKMVPKNIEDEEVSSSECGVPLSMYGSLVV